MSPVTVWTPDRLRIIKSLIKNGALVCTGNQAAILTGVSPYTVKDYLYKNGIRAKFPNVWTREHDDKLVPFIENGRLTAGINTVARALGVTPAVLAGQLRRKALGPKNSRGEIKRKVGQAVLALSRDGQLTVSPEVAAARIGCSVYAVEDMMKAFEISPAPGNIAPVRLPTPSRYPWTPARQRALKSFTRKGVLDMGLNDAALRLGCSIGQLRLGLQRIGARPKAKNTWSEEKLSKLRTLLNGHGRLKVSIRKACITMECNRKSLRFGLILLSKPAYGQFEWTPRRIAQLRALSDDGILRCPLQQAMTRLGCSEKVLRLAMQRLGLRVTPRFSWTPDAEAKLAALKHPNGKLSVTYVQAAEIIGCCPRSIDYKINRDRNS